MVVVICYAPSSVHATTSFMNGKGFFCTSWKQVEKSCRRFDKNTLVFVRAKMATGQEHILFMAALDLWCHRNSRNTHLRVSAEVAE